MSSRKQILGGAVLAIVLLVAGQSSAVTYVVDPDGGGDFTMIADAIAAAVDDDIIELVDHVYTGINNCGLYIGSRRITIRSASGNPEACIIDAELWDRCITFNSEVGPETRLEGVTIRNGASNLMFGYSGGGIVCLNGASPTIENCIIEDCRAGRDDWDASVWGGGMMCLDNSSPTITDCIFRNNRVDNDDALDYSARGGGLYCDESSPQLTNCQFVGNVARGGNAIGGGVCCDEYSSPSFDNCSFTDNIAQGWSSNQYIKARGGGLATMHEFCSLILQDCSFSGNSCNGTSEASGGGLYLVSASEIIDCEFTNNHARYGGGIGLGVSGSNMQDWYRGTIRGCEFHLNTADYGGGLYGHAPDYLITDCTFSFNHANNSGGALGVKTLQFDGSPVVLRNTIVSNTASSGGGIYIADPGPYGTAPATIIGNLIAGNSADSGRGGGVYDAHGASLFNNLISNNLAATKGGGVYLSKGQIQNCTITQNSAPDGGGLYLGGGNNSSVINSIFWENIGTMNGDQIYVPENLYAPYISYTDLEGGTSAIYVEPGGDVDIGEGMIAVQPLFVTGPENDYCLSQVIAGQGADSPCVDAGSTLAIDICRGYGLGTESFSICLNHSSTRTDEVRDIGQVDLGYHWGQADFGDITVPDDYATIQAAIDAAEDGVLILVRADTYPENIDFRGKAVVVRSESGPELTTIDGGQIGSVVNFDEGEGPGSVLQGFTIRNGYLTSGNGAGIYCDDTSPQILNNIITDNTAETGSGGGIYSSGGTPLIQGNLITHNHVGSQEQERSGGAIYLGSATWNSNDPPVNVRGNTIIDNHGFSGSAVYISRTNVVFHGCVIYGNGPHGFYEQTVQINHYPETPYVYIDCCDIFGNAGTDWGPDIGGHLGLDGNISIDPRFCNPTADVFTLASNSPCAEENNPGCGQIGALGVGCDPVSTTYLIRADGSGDFPTIQDAIDAAYQGDIIELAAGTFTGAGNRGLDFHGKAITVRSQSGDPTACIIDCENSDRGVHFQSAEGPGSVLQGVTITKGNALGGAGIRCEPGTAPRIQDCIFDINYTTDQGGAILCTSSSPEISNCIFDNNRADVGGGAIKCHDGASPNIVDCTFFYNLTDGKGGSIALESGSNPLISGCTIHASLAFDIGAGIRCYDSSPIMSNCIISFSAAGGAVSCGGNSNPVLNCCDIYGNEGGDWTGCIADQLGVDGNISEDPIFCDAAGFDYTLRDDSPCAEANSPCGQIGSLGVGCASLPTYLLVRADGSGEAATIQAAIDAIAPGGMIELADGTYTGAGNRDVDFGTKNLILRSVTNDETACIIDCQGSESEPHRGLSISSGQDPTTVIRGICIINGYHDDGGAIYIGASSPSIESCRFMDNTANNGGAIFTELAGEPSIADCHFEGNHANSAAGGIYFQGSPGSVVDSSFVDNFGYWGGGAVYSSHCAATITACLFVDNDGRSWGDALMFNGTECTGLVESCTFHGGIGDGATIYINGAAAPNIQSSIIAFGDPGAAISFSGGGSASLECCDIYGNTGGDWIGDIADQLGQNGNISDDPLFCDAAGGDFTLQGDSPCTETNSPCGQIGALGVGCGASLITVAADGSGDYATIQAAIDAISAGGVIELLDGTYTGAGNCDLNDRDKTFTLHSQSGNASACIIDCQGSEAEPHRGLTIDGGQDVDMLVANLTFTNAWHNGGGGLRIAGDSDPAIQDCAFVDNTSSDGGGIFVLGDSHPAITDCLFEGNSASNAGGAIRVSFAYGQVTGCTFRENFGYWGGGGIYFYASGGSVDDCLFVDNDCHSWGSALHIDQYESNPEMENCTIYGGLADAPSVYLRNEARPGFVNTIVAFNELGPAFDCATASTAEMFSCDIYGNAGGNWTSCIADWLGDDGNIEADPLFCDATGGDFTLRSDSPCAEDNSPQGQIGAFGVGCDLTPTEDIIGLYTDAAGTINWADVPTGQLLTLYLVIKNPSNETGIAAWECALPVPSGVMVADVDLYGGGVNYGTPPNYIVGFSTPLPAEEAIVLADLDYVVVNSEPQEFFITAADPSSVDPPSPIYLSADDPGLLIPLTPASGSATLPVFLLNAPPETYTVNPDGSGDHPNIRAAIEASVDGYTILLGDGTFTGPDNRDLDTMGKSIVIRSASRGAADCIIDCEGEGRAFHIHQGEGPTTVIEAITIVNGYAESRGGAILVGTYGETGASPTIRDCVFQDNVSDYSGGALDVWYMSHPVVSGCLFIGNSAGTYGGGVSVDFYSNPDFEGCTFHDNNCLSGNGDGGGLWISSDPASVDACIFWENIAELGDQIGLQNGATLDINCSNVMGGEVAISTESGCTVNWDVNNIWDYPLFCDPDAGDYTLADISACLPANNACGVQMGAYGEGCTMVGVPEDVVPVAHYLAQNLPNPFNPMTEIRFGVPEAGRATLRIYDLSGRCVRNLINGEILAAGHHHRIWQGRDDRGQQLASGIYFYRLVAGDYVATFKMTLIK